MLNVVLLRIFICLIFNFQEVLRILRRNFQKVIFFVIDGFFNGGDLRLEVKYLCDIGVKIFMFGIWNGNVWEFYDMVFDFKNEMCYILDMFEEFEVLVCWVLYEGMLCFFYCRFKYLRMLINCE